MGVALVTGSAGPIGSGIVKCLAEAGLVVVGVDADYPGTALGAGFSNRWVEELLCKKYRNYVHLRLDARDERAMGLLFKRYASSVSMIVHAAGRAIPEWLPNAGSFHGQAARVLLSHALSYCPDAPFVYASSAGVYGALDDIAVRELPSRFAPESHEVSKGLGEGLSTCAGGGAASVVEAETALEHFARLGMRTASFRISMAVNPGYPAQGSFIHDLVDSVLTGRKAGPYPFSGKRVVDPVHTDDLSSAFLGYCSAPLPGYSLFNMGGGEGMSAREAASVLKNASGIGVEPSFDRSRPAGEPPWWIGSTERFRKAYPGWRPLHSAGDIIAESFEIGRGLLRWKSLVRGAAI